MAITYIASTGFVAQGNSGGTTDGGDKDTTGANFIILSISYFPGSTPTISDTINGSASGNTWTPLTELSNVAFGNMRFYYCASANVGVHHKFSALASVSYASISGAAFASVNTTPFDQENGASVNSVVTSIQPGSVTPTSGQNDELIVTASERNGTDTGLSVNGSFNLLANAALNGGVSYGNSIAYKIKTDGAAENPTWSWADASPQNDAIIATFKAAAGGAATYRRLMQTGYGA